MKRGFNIQLNEPAGATYLEDLFFKIYDINGTLIHTTGSHKTDANVTLTGTKVYIANVDVGNSIQFKVSVHLYGSSSDVSSENPIYVYRVDLTNKSYIQPLKPINFDNGDYIELKVKFDDVTQTNPLIAGYPNVVFYQYATKYLRFQINGGGVNVLTFPDFVNDTWYTIKLKRIDANTVEATVNGTTLSKTSTDNIWEYAFETICSNATNSSLDNYWLNGFIEYIDFNGDKTYFNMKEVTQVSASDTLLYELKSTVGTDVKTLLV